MQRLEEETVDRTALQFNFALITFIHISLLRIENLRVVYVLIYL